MICIFKKFIDAAIERFAEWLVRKCKGMHLESLKERVMIGILKANVPGYKRLLAFRQSDGVGLIVEVEFPQSSGKVMRADLMCIDDQHPSIKCLISKKMSVASALDACLEAAANGETVVFRTPFGMINIDPSQKVLVPLVKAGQTLEELAIDLDLKENQADVAVPKA